MAEELKSAARRVSPIWWVLAAWILLNLLQSAFTELFHDEAYYWVWSRGLNWGYYDHPPMIALLIRIGTLFSRQEIGVRLLTPFLSAGTLLLIWKTLDHKNIALFFVLVFSMALVHVGGFLTAPDIPLIFFTALFFYLYKRFLAKENLLFAILLGLCAAAMLYSKYHGAMILFFVLLSNLKLLRKPLFWLIPAVALLVLAPHLDFAIGQKFETLRFHLWERSKGPWSAEWTFSFLAGQLAATGPFAGLLLFPAAFKRRAEGDHFVRSLQFSLYGILGFLILLSFITRAESNWAASAYVPLIILGYEGLRQSVSLQKWLWRLAIPAFLIFLLLRVYLVWDFLPELRQVRKEIHGWPEWAQQVRDLADGRPVVFTNSYQLPSKYMFYAKGETATTLNNFHYRRNQYDLLPIEEQIQGKSVLLMPKYHLPGLDTLFTAKGDRYYYTFLDNFRSYNKVPLRILEDKLIFPPDTETEITIRLENPYPHPLRFDENPDMPVRFLVSQFRAGKIISSQWIEPPLPGIGFEGQLDRKIRFRTASEAGSYQLIVSLGNGWLPSGRNGHFRKMVLKSR
jgi:hypothetical protein